LIAAKKFPSIIFCLVLASNFTEDRNSLAANYGKVGREGAKQIEEAGINLNSQYFVSRSVAEIPEFEERLIDDTAIIMNETSPSLLQAIQADILVLRKPTEPLALSANDTSIQLHSANSPSREIEAAYNTILGLIAKHNYCPADFLVMTPNIEDYHPFITAIFERQDSQLSYRIINSSLSQHHGYLSSFKNLITIVNGRWDSLSLLQLIEDPYIAKHFDFSDEDISLIRKWVETCHVTWGLDASHRNEYLLRHLCYQGMAEDAHIGTWSDGLKRLRQALVNGSHDLKIQFTEADLLSRLIYFLNSLQADLQSLADSSEMTLSDWTSYLECLSEGYLGNDESGQLKNILLQLKESSRWIPYDFLDFSSLSLRLDSLLDQQKASVQENLLNAVTFGNIRELSGQPAKVVIMIGMHEGAFPIAPREPKRDLLYGHKQADIKPTLTDLDRYYYLQTLMSAQDYLIFSYQNTCPRDGKQQEPALPITDLLSYIRCYYSEAKALIINHPFYSFDPAYFVQNASFKAYSYNDFSAASILADNKKMPDKGIVPELFQVEMIPPEKPQDSILSTDDLLKAAKDPLNLFLQGQGLYYKDFSDKDDTTDEPFILSTLDHYLIKKNLLTATLEDVLKQAHESGIMPLGLFEKAARLKPIETASLYQNVLNDFQVRNLYVCEFVPHCLQPTEVASNYWQLPAPKIQLDDGSQVTIVGKLNGISNKGLVNISKQESRQLIRSWPALLLAPYLTAVGMPARVLFLESAIQSKELSCSTLQDLKEFVQYAKRCKNHPSPLLDEYVEDFIKIENSSMLQSKILDRVKHSYNVKAKWIFSTKQQFSPEALKQWQTNAKHLYSKVLALKESAR
jgi:exodeoxyribonuclease V gamma subunit